MGDKYTWRGGVYIGTEQKLSLRRVVESHPSLLTSQRECLQMALYQGVKGVRGANQLRARDAVPEDLSLVSSTYNDNSQPSVTPVLENPMSSSGLCRHQVHR